MTRDDAIRLAVDCLRAEAESIRSGLQPLTPSELSIAAEADAAAAILQGGDGVSDAVGESDDPPPQAYARLAGAALRKRSLADFLMRLGINDPDAPAYLGASVSAGTDARITLQGIADRNGIAVDADDVDAAYHVLAAFGRVIASALAPPGTVRSQSPPDAVGADIVSDLDAAADTIRTWRMYLRGCRP